nr:putative protein TPRXL [Aegilops tauschii subsp. strangulata]
MDVGPLAAGALAAATLDQGDPCRARATQVPRRLHNRTRRTMDATQVSHCRGCICRLHGAPPRDLTSGHCSGVAMSCGAFFGDQRMNAQKPLRPLSSSSAVDRGRRRPAARLAAHQEVLRRRRHLPAPPPPSPSTCSAASPAQTCVAAIPSRLDYLRASLGPPATSSSSSRASTSSSRASSSSSSASSSSSSASSSSSRACAAAIHPGRNPLRALPEIASTIRWTRSSRASSFSPARAPSSIFRASPCAAASPLPARPCGCFSPTAGAAAARLPVLPPELLLVKRKKVP